MNNRNNRTCRRRTNRRRRTRMRERRNTPRATDVSYQLMVRKFLSELNGIIQKYPKQVALMAFIQLSKYIEKNYIQWPADDERIVSGIDSENIAGRPYMSEGDIDNRVQYANMDISNLVENQAKFLTNMVGGKNIKHLLSR
jgi:hypothetical protein